MFSLTDNVYGSNANLLNYSAEKISTSITCMERSICTSSIDINHSCKIYVQMSTPTNETSVKNAALKNQTMSVAIFLRQRYLIKNNYFDFDPGTVASQFI